MDKLIWYRTKWRFSLTSINISNNDDVWEEADSSIEQEIDSNSDSSNDSDHRSSKY